MSHALVQSDLESGRLMPVPDFAPNEQIEFSVIAMPDFVSIFEAVMATAAAHSSFSRKPFED